MKSVLWRFKFLGLLVLAFLIFIPTLVFGIGDSLTGYRINKNTANNIIYPTGHSAACITNASNINDYFIPTRTSGEFDSFEAHQPYLVSYRAGCDSSPAGVYGAAKYQAGSECGYYPTCLVNYYWGGDGIVTEGSLGGSCGLLKKWRHMRCASLFRPLTISQGEPCITAAVKQSDWGQIRFCYGTYDYSLHKCMYTGSTLQTVDIAGFSGLKVVNGPFQYGYVVSSIGLDLVGEATWGTCSTAAPCGDNICSTLYGETCASCPYDCGACPCGNYICDPGETCSSCPTDCGSCPCYNYYDQYSCESASCYWHSYGYVCSDTPCYYNYDQYSCQSAGCIWDSYYYSCVNSCSEIYEQYSCQSAGCTWDYYGYYCYGYY